jgi:DMSO/TMAO reductase YedYZ heme-binding membrane subunit
MSGRRRTISVFGYSLLITGLACLLIVWRAGFSEASFGFVLRGSARLALLVFLLVFVARPLRQLRPGPATARLLRNRRYIGVAFAAIMTVHLVFLLWFNGPVINLPGFITFALVYLMLATSFDSPAARLGPRGWRLLHKAGIYWLAIAFSATVISGLHESGGDAPVYVLLAALLITALALRIAAFVKLRRRAIQSQPI